MSVFGKTNIGVTPLNDGWHNSFFLCRYTAPEAGHISRISFLAYYGNVGNGKGIIYSVNPANNRPGVLLAEGSETPLTSWTWLNSNISYDVRAGEQLFIGIYMANNTWARGDPGLPGQTVVWYQDPINYPTVPPTFNPTQFLTFDSEMSVYAEYTPQNGFLEAHTFIGSQEYTSTVRIAGANYDVPTANPISLPPGSYTVLWDFYDISKQVDVVAGQTTVVNLIYEPPAPTTHRLEVNSNVAVAFNILVGGIVLSYQTPWVGDLEEGIYQVTVPESVTVDSKIYNLLWDDGSTNPVRNISLMADTIIRFDYFEAVVTPIPPVSTSMALGGAAVVGLVAGAISANMVVGGFSAIATFAVLKSYKGGSSTYSKRDYVLLYPE